MSDEFHMEFSMSRRRRRVDEHQAQVTAELRQYGVHVEPKLSRVGEGCPDLLCSWRGWWFVVELKNPKMPPSKRRLTPDEEAWAEAARAPVIVAETADEIIEQMMEIMK